MHESKEEFKQLIETTAQHFEMPKFYIEKDYWIVSVLKNIGESDFSEKVVFKGGTSLSKAYNIIKRYSEDIDLQFIDYKSNTPKFEMKALEDYISSLNYKVKTVKDGKERLRASEVVFDTIYPKEVFPVKENILLEMNFFSNPQPYEKMKIQTYIAEYLTKTGKSDYIAEYKLEPIKINTLDFRKTFLEKIFAILDNSEKYRGNKEEFGSKIRHLYDIFLLYEKDEIKEFINNDEFWEMANNITKENDIALEREPFLYSLTPAIKENNYLSNFSNSYSLNMKKLVWENLPDYSEVIKTFKEVSGKIIKWENEGRDFSDIQELKDKLNEERIENYFLNLKNNFLLNNDDIDYLKELVDSYLYNNEKIEIIENIELDIESDMKFEDVYNNFMEKVNEYKKINSKDEIN